MLNVTHIISLIDSVVPSMIRFVVSSFDVFLVYNNGCNFCLCAEYCTMSTILEKRRILYNVCYFRKEENIIQCLIF